MNPQPVHGPVGWRDEAACRDQWPLYDLAGDNHPAARRAAIRVCAACPVRVVCDREAALVGARWSISPGERPVRRVGAARLRGSCGTPSGLVLHRRYGELPCEPCRRARPSRRAGAA